MRMRARVWEISIATLLFVILAGATAVLAENRNDSRRDAHDARDVNDARHQGGKLQQQIDALKAQLAAAKASSASADAALQQQINWLTTKLTALANQVAPSGGSSLSVFDANGNKVGQVIGVDSDNVPWVLTTAHDASGQNYTFALKVFRGQLGGGTVSFSSSDCDRVVRSTKFIEPLAVSQGVYFGSSAISIAGVDYFHGGAVYAAPAGAPVTQVDLGSKAMPDGSCFLGSIGFPGSDVVPATPVTFSTTFAPPFEVR